MASSRFIQLSWSGC